MYSIIMTGDYYNICNSKLSHEQPDLFDDKPEMPESGFQNNNDELINEQIEELFEYSARAYHAITSAQMCETLSRSDVKQYIRKIRRAIRDAELSFGHGSSNCKSGSDLQLAVRSEADKAAIDRGDPVVRSVLDAAYRVDHEIHRLMGLLRFSPRPDGVWLARCAPDNFILPVFADHFSLRFGEAPWAIIDEKRNCALVRLYNKETCFGSLHSFPFLSGQDLPEDNWEELWRSYHRSVNIENRKNPALRLQFMPRRYWKYLPELNS